VIAILDYGAGNLRSVSNALRALDLPHQVIRGADDLSRASRIILPGVGHFGQMMRALEAMQVREILLSRISAGVPFLGICLGLHALFEGSEEAPGIAGLGLIPDSVRKFSGDMRVPHMGWNQIEPRSGVRNSGLLRDLPAKTHVYFAHGYYAPIEPSTSSVCDYGGIQFTAALEHENVFAIQFHPEKSGAAGQIILRNFAGL
jgi:imidazole glycerol phosphate synthase glutamine amidotransferase subunit